MKANESDDAHRANNYYCYLCFWNNAYKISAVPCFFIKKTYTGICSISWKSPAVRIRMLVIYCLKNVSLFSAPHGIPELIAIAITAGLHLWKKKMLLSIAGGTITYMLLVQLVF